MRLDTPASTAPEPEHLIDGPAGIDHLAFSVTNRCNLRCVYCPQGTHPDEFHADTPEARLELIRAFISAHGVRRVSLGYYGETMLIPGWERLGRSLIDLGVKVNFVSSFSRIMTPEETAVVSRFHDIQISIDTVEPDTLKRLRKAVDVRTILFNTHLIRSHVIANDLPAPRLIWTAVLTDLAVGGLPDLVAMAISSGVRDIQCSDLAYIKTASASVARHVIDMPKDRFLEAFDAVHRARRLALRHAISLTGSGLTRIARHAAAVLAPETHRDISRTLSRLEDIPPHDRLFIHGAGAAGRRLRERLEGTPVHAFIDSFERGTFDGLPKLTPADHMADRRPGDLILIASTFEDEIEAGLLRRGEDRYLRAFDAAMSRNEGEAAAPSGHTEDRKGIQGDYSIAGDATDDLPPGHTRLCPAPWKEAFLDPKGEVYSCCMRGHVMGKLGPDTGLEDVLRADAYRDLRRRLLSGQDLDPECRYCSVNQAVTPEKMRAWISDLFTRNTD